MLRPNPEALSTGAAVIDFIDAGPCTIGLDELDLLDAEARQYILLLWNLGHDRALAKRALMVKGKRKVVDFHAPMMAAGLGSFLADAQMTRTFILEMHKYTAETKPERKFKATDTADLDAVYSFLRHRTANMKLNLDPPMPPGVIARDADNACSLLAVADACGPEWGQRAREAILFLIEKARTEQPKIRMIRHGLAIFDALGIKQIRSTQFNKELKRLDLPDADWTRYRDLSGLDKAHPLTMNEQVKLLGMVGIAAKKCTPPGEKQFRGYTLAQFEEADRVYCASGAAAPRLRLITPPPIRASFPSHASRRGCDRRAIEGRLGHLGRPYRGGGIAGATDRRKESIMKVINEPGLAKVSSTDLLHELTNELVRVRRRLKRARLKFAGLQALKRDLQPYLQSGDYEHLLELLKREIERREREETELSTRCRDERFRQAVGDERFEKSRRELAEIHRKLGLD